MTKIHMCQSVKGPLKNWSKKQWSDAVRWISKDDGSSFHTGANLKLHFQQLLDAGNEVVPIGECDNFDPVHGCMGHPNQEAT